MQRFLSGFTNAFLVVFTVDAGLSILEELFRLATGSEALVPLRNAIATSVVMVAFLALFWLPLTPRLPARLLLPLFVGNLWLNYGAAPLPLWFDPPLLGFVASGMQLGLAAWGFAWLRRSPHAPDGWWDPGEDFPPFSSSYGLRVWAVLLFVLVPLASIYGVVLLVTTLEVGTARFVAFDRSGVTLADRSYWREGKHIRLVGMMHIGEGDAYRDLVASFEVASTVVLEEGVTDEQGVMDAPLSYDGVAGVLGLESQSSLGSYLEDPETGLSPQWPVLRHTDVDVSEFDPRTIRWLEIVQEVWAAEGGAEMLREAMRTSSEDPEMLAAVQRDIFDLRNQRLLAGIEKVLPEFDHVIVPWGALHLPTIEASLLAQGFELGESQRRRLLSWRTIADALARPPPTQDVEDTNGSEGGPEWAPLEGTGPTI